MFGNQLPGGNRFKDIYGLIEDATDGACIYIQPVCEFTHCYETRAELAHGGLLIMDNFGLQDAMSAIEVRALNFCATLWLRSG